MINQEIPSKNEFTKEEAKEAFKVVEEYVNSLSIPWKSSPEEPYSIRRFNPSNTEDTQRFRDMDRHPNVLRWMIPPEPSSPQGLDEFIRTHELSEEDRALLFAITDESDLPVGFVQFYGDEILPDKEKEMVGTGDNALVLETSYAKLFTEWPKFTRYIKNRDNLPDEESKRVAVNGLKQSMLRVREMEDIISQASGIEPREIFITAYTEPENTASEYVLEKNGFIKSQNQVDYDGEPNNFWYKKI